MRAVRPPSGRVRYHCRSKAQGIGCTGGGSFLDVYEQQLAGDLGTFMLPPDWQRFILNSASEGHAGQADIEAQRRQLEGRLERLKDLHGWGDLSKEQYLAERERIERELARLTPPDDDTEQLERLAAYVESLPAAWSDADQEQRNQLASLIYEELWVDGAAQPTKNAMSELSHTVRSGDPDGSRSPHLPSFVSTRRVA